MNGGTPFSATNLYVMINEQHEIVRCPECGNEIDPDVCWCGDLVKSHNPYWCGHNPVPMGCDCGRIKINDNSDFLSDMGGT